MNEDAVREWIQKAENDLKIGRDEMSTEEPVTDMVCFHMQQCAEKYLKAFLIFHNREYPRTHRLGVLVTLCAKIDPAFESLVSEGVDRLTPYATTLRYSEDFYVPPLEETERAIALAEKVKEFVRARLREENFQL